MKHLGSDPLKEFWREGRGLNRGELAEAADNVPAAEAQSHAPSVPPQHSDGEKAMRFAIFTPNPDFGGQVPGCGQTRFIGGKAFTNDIAVARHCQSVGYQVTDTRGAPGGMIPEGVRRFKVEVQAGRRMHGKSFRDASGLEFFEGIAETDFEPHLYTARELGYLIVDRWAKPKAPSTAT